MGDVKNNNIMELEVFEKTFKNFLKYWKLSGRNVGIAFSEGEPLLCLPDYYEKIIKSAYKIAKEFKVNLSFRFLTNGTLINKDYLKLFKKYKVRLSISLDGTKEHQDSARVFSSGKGTFDRVFENIKMVKKAEIPFNIITVLSKYNVNEIEDILAFYSKEGLNTVGINFASPSRSKESRNIALTPKEAFNAIKKIYNIAPKLNIKTGTVYKFRRVIRMGRSGGCAMGGKFPSIAFGWDGSVYACHRLTGDKRFLLGNLVEKWYDYDKHRFFKARKNVLAIKKCGLCKWFFLCGGGCAHNAFMAYGNIFEKDYFCETIKNVLDYLSSMRKFSITF